MIDNLYPENVEDSGAILRLTLKEIARHNLAYNPITYAVWYEYATGRNKKLNQEILAQDDKETPISFDMVLKWFRKYIASQQLILAEKKTREFQSILSEMTKQLGASGSRISDKGNELKTYAQRLGQTDSIEEIMDISQGIMSKTKSIISDSRSLKQEVNGTISEIDALKKELEGVKQAAKTDMLTGLLNRRGFDEVMSEVMRPVEGKFPTFSVIISDIDHFKKINDTHGHLIGDNVLKMIARLLQEHIKADEIAARFGGEEFIIVLPDTLLKDAYISAEQIRMNLKAMRWRTKSGAPIGSSTMSLGIAQYQPDESMESLIERADNALYQAKSTGRNRTLTELDIETG